MARVGFCSHGVPHDSLIPCHECEAQRAQTKNMVDERNAVLEYRRKVDDLERRLGFIEESIAEFCAALLQKEAR